MLKDISGKYTCHRLTAHAHAHGKHIVITSIKFKVNVAFI